MQPGAGSEAGGDSQGGPKLGQLTVNVSPAVPDAFVVVDGKTVGPAPWSGPVAVGPHRVEVRSPGYRSQAQTATVGPGGGAPAALTIPLQASARLSVQSNVAGAEVLIDGRSVGTAPLSNLEILATAHTIVVRKAGMREFRRSISPQAGEVVSVSAALDSGAAGSYVGGHTMFKFFAGMNGVGNVEFEGEVAGGDGPSKDLSINESGDLDGSRFGAALQFGSMTARYFGLGAVVGVWFADSEDGLSVSKTIEFSPVLELRFPLPVAGGELLSAYATGGGGLSVRILHDDELDAMEKDGVEVAEFGIGYNVLTALGVTLDLGGLGLFVEGGWQLRSLTHELKELGGRRINKGSFGMSWNEAVLSVGLAHVH